MNMYYTGLGIARSLGEHGIQVIGLTSQRGVYGSFTRYAKTVRCPDSRHEPEKLLAFLLDLAGTIGHRAVIFPTRDDDLVFLDRFRRELEPHYVPAAPSHGVLETCLDKWQTYLCAREAKVPSPRSWLANSEEDVRRIQLEAAYPCVLKPLASHYWRQRDNWGTVGGRKAIGIASPEELVAEYMTVCRADSRALVQEMVPGTDDNLFIAACFFDEESNLVAGFQARKRLQVPETYGTGCIVETVDRPEINDAAVRLLRKMCFTGIAEVEFKWNAAIREYQLIEVNARPWDQHSLGKASGVDLIHLAYCHYARLRHPAREGRPAGHKWIAEDVLLMTVLQMMWRRDPKLREIIRLLRGRRSYAISLLRDPLPFLVYLFVSLLPGLAGISMRLIRSTFQRSVFGHVDSRKEGLVYESPLQNGKGRG
jgi:predicted ATP-grasp superfamily ATP-dependent carboligase